MSPSETIDSSFSINWRHQVFFTRGVFQTDNPTLANTINSHPSANNPTRLLLVVDGGLAIDHPGILNEACQYFAQHKPQLHLAGPPLVVTGGETAKNDPAVLHSLYQEIHRRRIDRHSWVLALGGGALLDVVGFATATAHRGCRHLRLPTTTLAQADSGVGVKNGINLFGKKNFVGSFAPPAAVINDFNFLQTLPKHHLCSGCVEGLKVALIRDARFFSWIEQHAASLGQGQLEFIETLIHRCAELHVQHITTGGDPFETGSARPLDFGHWSAHKLEATSNYQLSHGDAVAIGIALDTLYARNIGLLNTDIAERILHVLTQLGFSLDSPELARRNTSGELVLLDGLDEFREHLGGQLTITLLRGIGSSIEVHEYHRDELEPCIRELHERQIQRPQPNK
ncbi:MAG: 3-dehydroquinate synthase [Limisphaerales bacterium]